MFTNIDKVKEIKRFLWVNLGSLIIALSIFYFLAPANLVTGGVSGMGIVAVKFFPDMNLGLFMSAMNIILLIVGFIFVGKVFGGYTIYSSFALSGIIAILEIFFPITESLSGDLLIDLIFGIFFQAVGIGILFHQGTSSGGTDVIAKIINKYLHVDIGKSILIVDIFIGISAIFVFGFRLGLYGVLGVIMNGIVIDMVIAGFVTRVNTMIISKNPQEIIDFILVKLDRGVTILNGTGAYTSADKKVLLSVLSKRQYIAVKKFLKEKDPEAFITMHFVHEVLGEGFADINA